MVHESSKSAPKKTLAHCMIEVFPFKVMQMQYRKVLALLLFSTCEGTKEKYFIEITAKDLKTLLIIDMLDLKLGYSEKATKFEKIFHLKFDATQ